MQAKDTAPEPEDTRTLLEIWFGTRARRTRAGRHVLVGYAVENGGLVREPMSARRERRRRGVSPRQWRKAIKASRRILKVAQAVV